MCSRGSVIALSRFDISRRTSKAKLEKKKPVETAHYFRDYHVHAYFFAWKFLGTKNIGSSNIYRLNQSYLSGTRYFQLYRISHSFLSSCQSPGKQHRTSGPQAEKRSISFTQRDELCKHSHNDAPSHESLGLHPNLTHFSYPITKRCQGGTTLPVLSK